MMSVQSRSVSRHFAMSILLLIAVVAALGVAFSNAWSLHKIPTPVNVLNTVRVSRTSRTLKMTKTYSTLMKLTVPSSMSGALSAIQSIATPNVVGGLVSGGLHAITGTALLFQLLKPVITYKYSGPDHLAAILPASVGKSGSFGFKMGTLWGLGHGMSVTLLGMGAHLLKGKLTQQFSVLERTSNVAGSIVGASLVLIGLLGIKESLEVDNSEKIDETHRTSLAVVFNGILHGFSWDGLPSLAPAIAMPNWQGALGFLLAYSLGTVAAMGVSAGTISSLTSRLGELSDRPDLPRKLSLYSSVFAVCIGVFWVFQALVGR